VQIAQVGSDHEQRHHLSADRAERRLCAAVSD
jgi:hypothetical protein